MGKPVGVSAETPLPEGCTEVGSKFPETGGKFPCCEMPAPTAPYPGPGGGLALGIGGEPLPAPIPAGRSCGVGGGLTFGGPLCMPDATLSRDPDPDLSRDPVWGAPDEGGCPENRDPDGGPLLCVAGDRAGDRGLLLVDGNSLDFAKFNLRSWLDADGGDLVCCLDMPGEPGKLGPGDPGLRDGPRFGVPAAEAGPRFGVPAVEEGFRFGVPAVVAAPLSGEVGFPMRGEALVGPGEAFAARAAADFPVHTGVFGRPLGVAFPCDGEATPFGTAAVPWCAKLIIQNKQND
jgi:hypothetical protein